MLFLNIYWVKEFTQVIYHWQRRAMLYNEYSVYNKHGGTNRER